MTLYVINLISNDRGNHEVHRYGCPVFPNNFFEIGLHETCCQAVERAMEIHPTATCCASCNPICYKEDGK
jgi:hypothetical protein